MNRRFLVCYKKLKDSFWMNYAAGSLKQAMSEVESLRQMGFTMITVIAYGDNNSKNLVYYFNIAKMERTVDELKLL